MYTVADQIADLLVEAGCVACFQVSGGMIAFLADAIDKKREITLYNLKHEQAAGFAAEGLSRFAGKPGVVLATSGPGATNLLTPIASCFFDSTPTIFITGQVHSDEIKKSPLQRQNGFQELGIAQVAESLVKFTRQISSPAEVLPVFREALNAATGGRPGPVLIDIPIDIQQMEAVIFHPVLVEKKIDLPNFEDEKKLLERLVGESVSPLILAGAGIRLSGATKLFEQFVTKSSIPVVWSLMAKDCLETDNVLNFGMIGSYGSRCANRSLAESDLLIVLGSRLDVRQTGPSLDDFREGRRIFRVDVDEAELDGRLQADFNVVADLKIFLEVLLGSDVSHDPSRQTRRFSHCAQNYPMQNEQEVSSALSPHLVMETISSIERSSSAYLVDVGQHQMWAAQSLRLEVGQRFLTSGGLGAMGFSIPAGIGVAGGSRERVAVIIGDGGAQMVLAELETVRFLNLPVRIYVINNNQQGMVAQFQEENLSARYVGTRDGYSAPNFSAIAQAFGIPSIRVTSTNELGALEEALARGFPTGPVLIEIVIDKRFKALPKLGKNNSLSAM